MKMTEYRSQQPLNDDDFAVIRRNVMTTIAGRKDRRLFPIVMRFALAAAVITAFGLVFVTLRPAQPSSVATKRPSPVVRPRPIAPVVVASVAVTPPIAPVVHQPRHHRAHPRSEFALVKATQPNIRLELRTSDPDIRIIWIANQTPSTPTGGNS
jgi:hypothetical protein